MLILRVKWVLGIGVPFVGLWLAACGDDQRVSSTGSSPSGCAAQDSCETRTDQRRALAFDGVVERTSQLLDRVTGACRDASLALGADPSEMPDATPPDDRLEWCTKTRELMTAQGVEATVADNICLRDPAIQAACEASCSGNEACESSFDATRCPDGALAGECNGPCESCFKAACNGFCSATCSGFCDGEVSMTTCGGTCEGTCLGICSHSEAPAESCEGLCVRDGCSGGLTSPRCSTPFKPPGAECVSCKTCQLLCDASAEIFTTCNTAVNVSGIAEPTATSFRDAMSIVEAAGLEAKTLLPAALVVENNRGGCVQIEEPTLDAAKTRLERVIVAVYGEDALDP